MSFFWIDDFIEIIEKQKQQTITRFHNDINTFAIQVLINIFLQII